MITFTLVAILGILLVIVLREIFKKQPAGGASPAKAKVDLANLKVLDARVGDTVSVPGIGDNFADLDLMVEHRNRYQAGERQWFELAGTYHERYVALEVAQDDGVTASAMLAPKLTLEQLELTEDDLAEIDERQNTADFFEYNGKPWYYRFSKETRQFRDGQPEGRGFYCWKFEEEGGKRTILIRKFEGEPFEALLAEKVNPADITVYRAG